LLLPKLKQSNPATITESDAYAERFVRSIKESCLDQMIFLVRMHCETPFENS
jgi:hypothetical protein